MYDLGIIGGMGPEATSEFFRRIVRYTRADTDQDHLEICILNRSSIPDRTRHILGRGLSPVERINECIAELVNIGCRHFAIPCNTAHWFVRYLNIPGQIGFINMIEETMKFIKTGHPRKPICILGTTGTIAGKVYEKYAAPHALLYPGPAEQSDIMEIILGIKEGGGRREAISRRIGEVMQAISDGAGDCLFVLACTELSIFSELLTTRFVIVDALDVLAVRSIEICGFKTNRILPFNRNGTTGAG